MTSKVSARLHTLPVSGVHSRSLCSITASSCVLHPRPNCLLQTPAALYSFTSFNYCLEVAAASLMQSSGFKRMLTLKQTTFILQQYPVAHNTYTHRALRNFLSIAAYAGNNSAGAPQTQYILAKTVATAAAAVAVHVLPQRMAAAAAMSSQSPVISQSDWLSSSRRPPPAVFGNILPGKPVAYTHSVAQYTHTQWPCTHRNSKFISTHPRTHKAFNACTECSFWPQLTDSLLRAAVPTSCTLSQGNRLTGN